MKTTQTSSSQAPSVAPAVRVGSALFFIWSVLHLWVGTEGYRQYLNGVHGQWEMLLGGANAPRQSFQHALDTVTASVHSHLLVNFTTDVGGYGVLGLFVAWALWTRASWFAYGIGLVVIGVADLAFLFSQVTSGMIELNAGSVGGPVIWAMACLITPWGLRRSISAEAL